MAWRQDFDEIISQYQSDNVASGTIRCIDYEAVMSGLFGGSNPSLIRPCTSDFIADVELAARHALRNDKALLNRFIRVYMNMEEEPDLADMDIDAIRLIVGREFFVRRISPQAVYRKVKYVDRNKGTK